MKASFVTANFVAREIGYRMPEGWGQGDRATNDAFKPIETFAERFELMIEEVAEMGFGTIDLWTAHLNPLWATDRHVSQAKAILMKNGISVYSLAGGFGSNLDEFRRSCEIANQLGAKTLGGFASTLESDRDATVAMLREYAVTLGLENHPEKTPDEVKARLTSGDSDVVGACVDTGWWGTQGYDAANAIRELGMHVKGVHLKDVAALGSHESCALGKGVVPIRDCVVALYEAGYKGALGIEHEPNNRDPRTEVAASLAVVEAELAALG